jgi:hypothetical protein
MLNKELVNYQNKLFYVYKKIKQDRIKDGYVNDIKDFWLCDVVVRSRVNNDDTLLFLREIEEAHVVKDII